MSAVFRRLGVPALPRPVVGVSLAVGDQRRPYIRTVALPPAVGGTGAFPPSTGPPVVGVPPAAGDKPQPYIRTAALPPAVGDTLGRAVGDRRPYIRTVLAGWGLGAGGTGFRPSTSGGRCFAGGGGQAPALH